MATVQLLKARLRTEQADEAVRWVRALASRRAELDELCGREERLDLESVFLEQDGETWYLYQYVRVEDGQSAFEAFMRSESALARETRQQMADAWEQPVALELAMDWQRGEAPG